MSWRIWSPLSAVRDSGPRLNTRWLFTLVPVYLALLRGSRDERHALWSFQSCSSLRSNSLEPPLRVSWLLVILEASRLLDSLTHGFAAFSSDRDILKTPAHH